jgi:hypothetical protein
MEKEILENIEITEKNCVDCFSKQDRKEYARLLLTPYFNSDFSPNEEEVRKEEPI